MVHFPACHVYFQRVFVCFLTSGYPQITHFHGIFHYKPSIWGYPLWNPLVSIQPAVAAPVSACWKLVAGWSLRTAQVSLEEWDPTLGSEDFEICGQIGRGTDGWWSGKCLLWKDPPFLMEQLTPKYSKLSINYERPCSVAMWNYQGVDTLTTKLQHKLVKHKLLSMRLTIIHTNS